MNSITVPKIIPLCFTVVDARSQLNSVRMLIGDRDQPKLQKTGPHTRFTSRRQASANSSGRLTGQPFLAGLRNGSSRRVLQPDPSDEEEDGGPNGVAVCFAKCTIFLFSTVTFALGLATLGLGVATFRSLSDLHAQLGYRAAPRLRPICPPARPDSARFNSGRPRPASGQPSALPVACPTAG